MMYNHCVQATPDYALQFIVAQVSGAPDAECLPAMKNKQSRQTLRMSPALARNGAAVPLGSATDSLSNEAPFVGKAGGSSRPHSHPPHHRSSERPAAHPAR